MVTAARKYLTENLFLQAPPSPCSLALLGLIITGRGVLKNAVAIGGKKNKSENLLKFNFHLRIISAFPDSELF